MVKAGKILHLNERLSVFVTDGVIPRGAHPYFLSAKIGQSTIANLLKISHLYAHKLRSHLRRLADLLASEEALR